MTPNSPLNEESANPDNQAEVSAAALREKSEPSISQNSIPLWLVGVFFVIIFWAGCYLAINSGGFSADVYNPTLVSWAGGGSGGVTAVIDPKVVGKRVFNQNCAVCHQSTGLGVAGQFPPLSGSEWVVGGDWVGDNHLVKILLFGMQGVVQVKGGNYNNAMPAWNQLKDEQISAVLTYIRSDWGNNAQPITTEYVKSIREKTGKRTDPWSQKELKTIPAEKADTQAPAATAAPAKPAA